MARHLIMGFTYHLTFVVIYKVDVIKEGIRTDEETEVHRS